MHRDCEILASQQISDMTYAITVDAGEIALSAQPGQFIHILCGDAGYLRRPISICDAAGSQLKIVFDAVGEGTRWLSRKKSGYLDIMGPLGKGFDLSGRNILLVGGGIGAPPLLFAAKRAIGIVTGILGFRCRERAILLKDFQAYCQRVYLTTNDGSLGAEGLVTDPLERCLEAGGYDGVLACGPRAMLRPVAELAAGYGVPCQVSLEERMGCGVGACLVCACKIKTGDGGRYAHVCKDGPVFRAEEVDWNE